MNGEEKRYTKKKLKVKEERKKISEKLNVLKKS